jgi:hypothetical protein
MSGARLSDHELRRLGFDPAFAASIHAGTDQSEAAFAEAWHYDNTDKFDLGRSGRLEKQMTHAVRLKQSDWVFAVKHERDDRPGDWTIRLIPCGGEFGEVDNDTLLPALGGGILGFVSSKEPDAYVIGSGRISAWIEFVGKECACAVRLCYDPLPTKVRNVIVAARGQRLIATPCCDACLEWLQDDQHDLFCNCCESDTL